MNFKSFLLFFVLVFTITAGFSAGQEEEPQNQEPPEQELQAPEPPTRKLGTILDIPLPITRGTVQPIYRSILQVSEELRKIAQEDNSRKEPPILILRFQVPPNQEVVGRGSQFGACVDLADLLSSDELRGIRTVGYFPQSVQGHVMLVASALQEWILADNVEIGNAGVDEKRITPAMRQAYLDVGRRFQKQIVLKMLDPSVELWKAETVSGFDWTDANGVKILRDEGKLVKDPDEAYIPAGTPGVFTAQQARQELGLAEYLTPAKDGELALLKALSLKPEQVSFAKIYTNTGRAVRIDLTTPITAARVSEVQRQILSAITPNESVLAAAAGQDQPELPPADFICLWIDTAGGSLTDSLNLATFLTNDIDPMKVRTVAYVPHMARADAAIVALACQEVVLGPDAILGGSGAANFTPDEIAAAKETISKVLAKKTIRRWSLLAATIDPNLDVFRMTRKSDPSVVEYFCEEEWNMQGDKDDWVKGERVTTPGQPREFTGQKAVDFFVADKIAANFNEFKLFYNLDNDPTLLEPGWADKLIRALANPFLSAVVLMVGFIALFSEMKFPGIGLGAFVAICCFALFFWSHFLGGTAGWFEIMLFFTGVLLILMEIFVVPGFGVFGIGGGIAVLASLVLASQTFIIPRNPYQLQQFCNSLWIVIVSIVGMCSVSAVLVRWLHDINRPTDTEFVRESEKLADYAHLLGREGIANTPLVPSGKATFGDETLSVVSDCELIETGTPVIVSDVKGYRVVVKRIESTSERLRFGDDKKISNPNEITKRT